MINFDFKFEAVYILMCMRPSAIQDMHFSD